MITPFACSMTARFRQLSVQAVDFLSQRQHPLINDEAGFVEMVAAWWMCARGIDVKTTL